MAPVLEYMKSIDFQAAYTVYDKNKRLMDLDHRDLLRLELVSYYLSESRKESGKLPNVDYLVQEVGNWLRGSM